MIKTFEDLKTYIKEDSKHYPKQSTSIFRRITNIIVTNPINTRYHVYNYVRNLRHSEFHLNNSIFNGTKSIIGLYHTFMMSYYYWKLRQISYKTGIQIPPNTCDSGLKIWHYGYIIINSKTRIGKNLTIYPGVEIGQKTSNGGCPIIGDNCFIGAGAKIFGNITIGKNVTIAANAVVVNNIPDNAVVGGVPAIIIKIKNIKELD